MTEIRSWQPGDETGIRALFELCHKRPLPVDVWAWRYAAQSWGKPAITVAVDNEKIVGHVAALPVVLERSGEPIDAGLWVDLMVDPAHRNLTLFLDMAEANREQCRNDGKRLLYAFPNDRSYPVLKRMLGWNEIEELDALEAPLVAVHPPRSNPKSGQGAETNIFPIDRFDDSFDALWGEASADALAPERSAQWLNWRYRSRPGATYPGWRCKNHEGATTGWIITKIFDSPAGGRIGDVLELCAEPHAKIGLLGAALDYFRTHGVNTVSAWATRDTVDFERFLSWGLTPQGPRTHFAGRWTSPEEPMEFPSRGKNWRINKGDSDVF